MKNTSKLLTTAALIASTATASFAGGPDGILDNVVEEPVIVETGEDWRMIAGVAVLGAVVACALACGSDNNGSNNSTSSSRN